MMGRGRKREREGEKRKKGRKEERKIDSWTLGPRM